MKYAVLNTERNTLLKLGQFGPHLTGDRERAAREAAGYGDHCKFIEISVVEGESETDDDEGSD